MSRIVYYTNPMSRGRIGRWMLEEVAAAVPGFAYEVELLDFGPDMRSAEFLALNPMGKVPVLRHDRIVVTENAAICAWLAEAYPQAGLAPEPESAEKAQMLRGLFFAAGPLEAAISAQGLGFTPDARQEQQLGWGSLERVLATIDRQFVDERDYWCGARFTAADVMIASQLSWGRMLGTLPERESVGPYLARCRARAAAKAAHAADTALMPKKGSGAG